MFSGNSMQAPISMREKSRVRAAERSSVSLASFFLPDPTSFEQVTEQPVEKKLAIIMMMLENGFTREIPEKTSAPRKRLVTMPSISTAMTPVNSVKTRAIEVAKNIWDILSEKMRSEIFSALSAGSCHFAILHIMLTLYYIGCRRKVKNTHPAEICLVIHLHFAYS